MNSFRDFRTPRSSRERGHAVIEVSLLAPWIFFLFAGVFNFGFFAYALISTQNAARVGAAYAASGPGYATSTGKICALALGELRATANIKNDVTSCGGSSPVSISVTAPELNDVQVTVTYQTVQLFPLPGLAGKMTINRSVRMKLNQRSGI